MSDQKIVCVECGREFAFTEGEQLFFTSKSFTPPKRCAPCRARKRAERELAEAKGERNVKRR